MWTKKDRIFYVLYAILAKRMPYSRRGKVFKMCRGFFAKKIMKKVGKNVNIETGAIFNPNVTIGDNSTIGVNCEVIGKATIGKNVLMGPEVVLYAQNHKFKDKNMLICDQGYDKEKGVVIEDDVWIGRRVIILPGVTIKKGTVIGAGAIVTKTFPEYSIIAGNPAKVIGNRK